MQPGCAGEGRGWCGWAQEVALLPAGPVCSLQKVPGQNSHSSSVTFHCVLGEAAAQGQEGHRKFHSSAHGTHQLGKALQAVTPEPSGS